jgi:hypothetical protein
MHGGRSPVPYGCTYLLLWGWRFMVKQQNTQKKTFYANKSVDGLQLGKYLANFGKWGTILIVTSCLTLSMPYFTSGGHFSDLLRCSKVRQLKVVIVTLRSDQQGDTDLVFLVGIWLVFLGNYRTDTGGKLGRYILVLLFWQEPLFSSKGGSRPPFSGAQPPF